MCRFIRRLCESSSDLSTVRVIRDPYSDDPNIIDGRGPLANFDGLIQHLSCRHLRTLRVLDLPLCFIGSEAFAKLKRGCGGRDGDMNVRGGMGLDLRVVRLAVRYDCFVRSQGKRKPASVLQDCRICGLVSERVGLAAKKVEQLSANNGR